MTDQYEIREDHSNKYWPFQVWNTTKNWKVDTCPTKEEAQERIDRLSKPVKHDLALFNMIHDPDDATWGQAKEPSPPAPKEETELVGNTPDHAGDEITDKYGNVYIAIQDSYYVSIADAADMEDGWDAQVSVGWHTLARLKSPVIEVVMEQVKTGQAKITMYPTKEQRIVTQVLFLDEQQYIPLDDLAYSSELGLYQKSKVQ